MSFFGNVAHALNPMTGLKAGAAILSNPFHPVRGMQQAARQFLPSGGGRPPGPQTMAMRGMIPGGQNMTPPGYDPNQYPQQAQYDPNQYPQQGYGGYSAPPPPLPSYYPPPQAPAPSYAPAAPQYFDPGSYGTSPTGWDASYGGGSGDDSGANLDLSAPGNPYG